ncbi:hypothetical protein F2Q69_00040630 [Brassica cretica]|uniref:Uncharacterized protein n=1 Tax=Brassica cretica TaxID=69181 RepID=A0A8S9NG97_BRACR|nr:hypothetical protein F2Q69_00040630 [Brassica cretica]
MKRNKSLGPPSTPKPKASKSAHVKSDSAAMKNKREPASATPILISQCKISSLSLNLPD